MVKRFYADNFRCLINFEVELNELNIFLGSNGSGKTSVLDALRRIQALIARDARIDEVFPVTDLGLSQNDSRQRFELDLEAGGNVFQYQLEIEHHADRRRMKIIGETLRHADKPIFVFRDGTAHLYRDDYTRGPVYPFDWSRSGVGSFNERPDNRTLTCFKHEVARLIIASPCPPLFRSETRSEDEFLEPLMQNFVGWYRRAAQEDMGGIARMFAALGEVLPGFDSINLTDSGENARALKVDFRRESGGNSRLERYAFPQLSDGQRALIALYGLLLLAPGGRPSLFLDEPDNYLALREVQPWFAALAESCGDSIEQAVVVSHHPVTIDYLAGASGRWFYRDGSGPARVTAQPDRMADGLSISETIARGWDGD